jgi:hypothetical protein
MCPALGAHPLRAGGIVLHLTCELAGDAERQARPHADGNSAAGPANGPPQLTSLVTNGRAAHAGRKCKGTDLRVASRASLGERLRSVAISTAPLAPVAYAQFERVDRLDAIDLLRQCWVRVGADVPRFSQ